MLSQDNELPTTIYEAKQHVFPLRLEVQNTHACPNSCIPYYGDEYDNFDACPICCASYYKIREMTLGMLRGASHEKRS